MSYIKEKKLKKVASESAPMFDKKRRLCPNIASKSDKTLLSDPDKISRANYDHHQVLIRKWLISDQNQTRVKI